MTRRRHVRAFTLLELSSVLAIMAVTVALAVPSFSGALGRARRAEVDLLIESIAHAERTYRRDHGSYLACGPTPVDVPRGIGVPFEGGSCWQDLGVRIEGDVRYRYRVEVDGAAFRVVAEGDLDGDGETSRFVLDGSSGSLQMDHELE